MINSRDLGELTPQAQALAKAFIEACKKVGIDVLITSTYRDGESQNALYAQGRTMPGPVVTGAKAGESFHNYRVAFDFCPIVNGKAQWNDARLFARCGAIAESVGLEWAGRWVTFREMAHCQVKGLKLADLKADKQR
jgi:peptidoglycan L-alanyl-D-glutamate endopeptidase CwlK